MNNALNDLEQLKRLIVEPMVATLREEMSHHVEKVAAIVQPVVERAEILDRRVGKLERDQKKGMVGWGVLTLAVGTAVTAGWNYLKSKVHLG